MPEFPIFLQLQERLCVVVGGGAVGRRKAQALLKAGGRVRLVGPESSEPPPAGVERIVRPYRQGDLAGAFLAFAATDDRQVNAAVVVEARAAGIPVNVADLPEEGNFLLPATLHRGDLTIAVSTGGRTPALAALIRDRLDTTLGPEWSLVLEIAAGLRQKKLTLQPEVEYNSQVLQQLLAGGLPDLLAAGAVTEIDRLLVRVAGAGCSLAGLGIFLPKGES
jgi:precorrin-2 dehydrogenase/sirohydrochlorin ferrochelatase